jgi:bifunctional UDP-N-acetylglucosamine pyrophosphorylase/glucosamine-1-phosphate N-acetyltransferase
MKTPVSALVLAAGQGSRFRSTSNKLLHPILGSSSLGLVLDAVGGLKLRQTFIVIGYDGEAVKTAAARPGISFVRQKKPNGTGGAVIAARSVLARRPAGVVLVVAGDLPLLRTADFRALLAFHRRKGTAASLLSAVVEDPTGYGRIVRDSESGRVRIIEERDANRRTRAIREVALSVYAFNIRDLLGLLPRLKAGPGRGEIYLTDAIGLLSARGRKIGVLRLAHPEDAVQVNSRFDLSLAAHALRLRKIFALGERGVTVLDPLSTWIDLDVDIGSETVVYPGVVLERGTTVGRGCRIYPGAHLISTRVGNGVRILSATVAEDAVLEDGVAVGPFARLRPKTVLRAGSHVGNFVEMKNADFGPDSKAGHLSYLGDSRVGKGVNIGAGTITCNFDGVRKNRTVIEDGVFIGSGTELIAPVTVGRGAYVAAGSVITEDVSPDALAIARGRQVEKPGWARRNREKAAGERRPKR